MSFLTRLALPVIGACSALLLVPTSHAAAPAEPAAEAGVPLADLRIELRTPEGTPLRFMGRKVELEGKTELVLIDDNHEHRVHARLQPRDEGRVTLTLRYVRDTATVFDGVKLDVALGGPATAREIGEATVQAKVTPGGKRLPKIEMPDGDNPLDGI